MDQIEILASDGDNIRADPATTGDAKSNADTTPTLPADNNNLAATAFQAQMSISSHLQRPAIEGSVGKVDAPVGSAGFPEELGNKITWMTHQGLQSASLRLSPEHLGPVDVRIAVQNGSATVSFNAMHADTRAALEQALPQLREMFATQGLTLADANVSQQSPRGHAHKPAAAIGSVGRLNDEPNSTALTSVANARLGLLDTYA